MEDRGAHQRRVDRHAAPRPEDRIDVDRVAELHRHRRAEEQQRPGTGAVRPQPPDGGARDQVDRSHERQQHVEEHRERRPRLGGEDRGDANRQAAAIALPEQIGGREALAQVGQRALASRQERLAVDLEHAVADLRGRGGRRRAQPLDHGEGAEARRDERVAEFVLGNVQRGRQRQEDRDQRPGQGEGGGGAAQVGRGCRVHGG